MNETDPTGIRRWWFVTICAAVMGVAGTYQFVWSSISDVVGARLEVSGAALGTVYTLFIVSQTLSQFPAGRVRDRYGPRVPLAVGALLLGAGYVGTAYAGSLTEVYVAYVLGGIGAGAAYTVAINTPVKWFTVRRGLATGVVGMAYGAVSVLLIPSIRGWLDTAFGRTMIAVGAAAAVVCLVGALFLRDPARPGAGGDRNPGRDRAADDETRSDGGATADESAGAAYSWREAVRTWQFWLMYAVMVIVNGVGLMVIGKAVSFAAGLGLSPAAATGAASLLAFADGTGVVVGGGASDRFGPKRTTAASLLVAGVALAAATAAGELGSSVAFVVLLGSTAFFRSPVFAIFPGLVGEYYGAARSSENYAVLYSSKVWGGIIGGTATSALVLVIGWTPTFLLGAVALALSGVSMLALHPVEGGGSRAGRPAHSRE